MKSIVATTYELIDMAQAAEDLIQGIKDSGEPLLKNSIGILFCDSELFDHEGMAAALHEALGMDIAGCTTVALLNNEEGFSEMCSRLMVLTADDCEFSVGLSEPITKDNVEGAIAKVYEDTRAGLKEKPGLIFAFPSYNLDIVLDVYPAVLSKVSDNVPVFGGLPAANDPYGKNAVVLNGALYTDRLILIGVTGNIKPMFSSGVELSHVANENRKITSAEGNVIYKVDDMTFVEYLESVGLPAEKLANDTTNTLFVANPLLLTVTAEDGQEHQIVRSLHGVDLESGCCVAIGMTPQDAKIAIGSLSSKDITSASMKTVAHLLAQIEAREKEDSSYRYSTLIAASCIGRFMVMMPKTDLEGKVLLDMLPSHMNVSGFYGYGEIGPTTVKDGVAYNVAQNESLILCAF